MDVIPHPPNPWDIDPDDFPLDGSDADQREMFISLGCALENLLIVATHFGYRTAAPDPRFDAITRRRTNHGVCDGKPVSRDELDLLCESCTEPDLQLHWITDEAGRAKVDALVMRADAVLLSDAEYRRELGEVIGSGAFGAPWLIATLGRFAVSHLMPASSFSKADHKALMSSPAIGIICAPASTRQTQVRAGQVVERLYLAATLRGLALQPVSQILEVVDTRDEVGALVGHAVVPIQPFRLGHASSSRTHTPRRPLDEVLL